MNQKKPSEDYQNFIEDKLRNVNLKLDKIRPLETLPQSHLTLSQKDKLQKKDRLLQGKNFYENSLKLYATFTGKQAEKEIQCQNEIEALKQENKQLRKRLSDLQNSKTFDIHLRDILTLCLYPSFSETESSNKKESELLKQFAEQIFLPQGRISFKELLHSSQKKLNYYLEQSQEEIFSNYSYERLFYTMQKITQNDKFQQSLKTENKNNLEEKKVSWVDINDSNEDDEDDEEEEIEEKQKQQETQEQIENNLTAQEAFHEQQQQEQTQQEQSTEYQEYPNTNKPLQEYNQKYDFQRAHGYSQNYRYQNYNNNNRRANRRGRYVQKRGPYYNYY